MAIARVAPFDHLVFDDRHRIWVEAARADRFEYSDGNDAERWLQRVIVDAPDLRVGAHDLERVARDFTARYHLSGTRANLLQPLRDALRSRVLEVGAGCGALTRFLGENGGSIVALEGSRRRAALCRARCRGLDNVEVVCADATRRLPAAAYDAVLLVGVLEYAGRYLTSPTPHADLLRLCGRALDPDGLLVLAIENRLGLKYLAGAPEDHVGVPFAGLHDAYDAGGPATFGRVELEALLRHAGFVSWQFLYPFPDYKFPRVILSAAAFEGPPVAVVNLVAHHGAEDQAVPYGRTFAEEAAWAPLARNRLGAELANSFLVVASKAPTLRFAPRLAYAYSSRWRRCFQKEVVVDDAGDRVVVRRAYLYPGEQAPASPYHHRLDDEPYLGGVLWGHGIYDIVNRDGWTIAQVGDWARPWVDFLSAHEAGDGDAVGFAARMVAPALLDCTPFNVMRMADGTFVPFDQEWCAESPLPLGYLVFRGLVSTILRIRSTAAPADATLDTIGSIVDAVMRRVGVGVDAATLQHFAGMETRFQAWVTGQPHDPATLLTASMPPPRVPPTVDAGAALARLRRDVDVLTSSWRAATADVAARDEVIRTLQSQLAEQAAWAQASAAEVARRDADVQRLQASLDQQARRARESAAEVARRDGIIVSLQAAVDEQTRWAQASDAAVAARDAIIADLQAAVAAHAAHARASAEDVTHRDGLIGELNARLDENRRALADARHADAERVERLERAAAQHTEDVRAHLASIQQQLDDLLARSGRTLVARVRHALRPVDPEQPRVDVLTPGWTEAGEPFGAQPDGRSCLTVDGAGFGPEAIVVVAGWPMETFHVSDRRLSASVPDELFARSGALSVWVDNHDAAGRRSGIRVFRVMSRRTVAAYGPVSGRGRATRRVVNSIVWLASGTASRLALPLLCLQRFVGARSRAPVGPPRVNLLDPPWTQAGEGFHTHADGRAALGIRGSGFGDDPIVLIGGWPMETHRVSGQFLTAFVPADLFARSGVLSVWVDNREGPFRRSSIRRFRVVSARAVAAGRPAEGRWRRLRGAANFGFRLGAAAWVRLQVPRLHLERAQGKRRRRVAAVSAVEQRRAPAAFTPEMVASHLQPASLPRKPDIICFSIIDWDFRYQRPQQILRCLVDLGHRVFYLSQRFLPIGGETFRLRPLVPGVTEVFLKAPSAPNIYTETLDAEEEEAVYSALLDVKAAAGLAEAICFVQLPFWTPLALRLQSDLGYRVVFDCLDDFSGFQNIGRRMADLERALAAGADLVVASSRILADKHAAHAPLLVPNAADYAHFSATAAPPRGPAGGGFLTRCVSAVARWISGRRPRAPEPVAVLGYYGAIAHWFDAELIAAAARARPQWRFVLIGRTEPDVRAVLGDLSNVRLVGELPYVDLPSQLATFDVCLIPFVVDDLVRATSPVKFFEYLAAGKPVVAARMPELLPFVGESFLYEGLAEFLGQVDRALAEKDDPRRLEARRAVARAHTWPARADVISRALDRLYRRASVIVVTYNGLPMTRACVESLLARTAWPDWELIVVDNHSSDETPTYLSSLAERYDFVRVVLNDSNRGFAAANNQGIRLATGDVIVLLNNDTVVTQGWLGGLVRHLNDPTVGLVGPVTNMIGNEARVHTDYGGDVTAMEAFAERYTRVHRHRVFDIAVLAMFCVAIPRSVLDAVGLLDERYEVGMFEDDDYARAVKAHGYRVVCAEDIFIHHVGGGSFRTLDPEMYRRIFEANRRRYEEKWGESWVPHRHRANEDAPADAR